MCRSVFTATHRIEIDKCYPSHFGRHSDGRIDKSHTGVTFQRGSFWLGQKRDAKKSRLQMTKTKAKRRSNDRREIRGARRTESDPILQLQIQCLWRFSRRIKRSTGEWWDAWRRKQRWSDTNFIFNYRRALISYHKLHLITVFREFFPLVFFRANHFFAHGLSWVSGWGWFHHLAFWSVISISNGF